jgi:hypothetical protein
MARQMEELSKVCMEEWEIIQEACKALEKELDALWDDIAKRINGKGENEAMLTKMPIRKNDSTPGHYLTQRKYQEDDKNLPSVYIEVFDPRVSGIARSYKVHLFWAGRKQFFRNNPGTEERLKELAKEEGVVLLPLDNNSIVCQEPIRVISEDLDETMNMVSQRIIAFYRIATELLKWLSANNKG